MGAAARHSSVAGQHSPAARGSRRLGRSWGRWAAWCAMALAVGMCMAPVTAAAELDAAPLAAYHGSAPGAHWRALGPLFEDRESADGKARLRALPRPFYVEYTDRANDWLYRDYLWPLGAWRERPDGGYAYWLLYFRAWGKPGDTGAPHRHWLIPFWLSGHTISGHDYHYIFPLGGTVGDVAGFDEITSVLGPLYVTTLKGETRSEALLWPFISQTYGPRIEKRRLFPLVGFTRTEHEYRRFIAWPFGHYIEQYPDAAGKRGSGWFVLPFVGKFRQTDAAGKTLRESWSYAWPFFSGEKSAAGERLYCPWPFFRRETATTKDGPVHRYHLWPFYGHEEKPTRDTGYVLWPFWSSGVYTYGPRTTTTAVCLPFYWATDTTEKGQRVESYRQIWPLWRRETAGPRSRDEVLSLWPQHRADAIQRDYAPFWTLYSRDVAGAEVHREAVWGWWQWHTDGPAASRWSLFPLIACRHTADGYDVSLAKGLAAWGRDATGRHGRALWVLSW